VLHFVTVDTDNKPYCHAFYSNSKNSYRLFCHSV